MSFIDRIIDEASKRGAAGAERVLTALTSEAAVSGEKLPAPSEWVDRLPVKKNDEFEIEPLVFCYALYLMVEYGYEVKDARRLANKFRTELDGYMVAGNVLITKTNLTTAELEHSGSLAETAVSRKVKTLGNSVKSLVKMVADGKTLSNDERLAIANLVDDLRPLVTTSQVEALV